MKKGSIEGRLLKTRVSFSKKLNSLPSDFDRLVYSWGIAHCSQRGRITGDAQEFKAKVFPLREDVSSEDVEASIRRLADLGLIWWYKFFKPVEEDQIKYQDHLFIQFTNWDQNISPSRMWKAIYPEFSEETCEWVVEPSNYSIHKELKSSVTKRNEKLLERSSKVHNGNVNDNVNVDVNDNVPALPEAHLKAAQKLFYLVKAEKPNSLEWRKEKTLDGVKVDQVTYWAAQDIRLMIEQDKRTIEDISKVIDAVAGDPFWRTNILSMGKLRQKWAEGKIDVVINRGGSKQATTQTPSNDSKMDRLRKKQEGILNEKGKSNESPGPGIPGRLPEKSGEPNKPGGEVENSHPGRSLF